MQVSAPRCCVAQRLCVTGRNEIPVAATPELPSRTFTPPTDGETIDVGGKIYRMGKLVGHGAFRQVYDCTDEWDNELVAKVLLPRNRPYEEIKEHFNRETQRLIALRHPNVTFMHNAFECRDTFYVILERCHLTLSDVINFPQLNPDLWIKQIARDVLQAVEYIHVNGYVHKDIHPGNVFASLA